LNSKNVEERKLFHTPSRNSESEYETLGNLRMKRMRESLESPVFGSKIDSFQSQRNLGRGLTLTSKDELESAQPPSTQLFKKKLRFFSFHESDNSSFPSSHNNSAYGHETSKGSNNSNKTSNFKGLQKNSRKSNSSGKNAKLLTNPKNFKNHLKSIAFL